MNTSSYPAFKCFTATSNGILAHGHALEGLDVMMFSSRSGGPYGLEGGPLGSPGHRHAHH